MFPGSAIDLLFPVLLKDLTVVQKLVLGNWSTAVLSPSVAAATPPAASGNFLHVVETPSAAFGNFFLFPQALSTTAAYFVHVVQTPPVAFENIFLVPEALSIAAAYFFHVAQYPLGGFDSPDTVL